jgi:DNA-binding HxlR family transcriptional regulator
MAGKRKYDEGCAMSHALDLVGERWALLIVRELLFGPMRFTDLRTGIRGVSPDVLSQRLRELHDAGVVRQRRLARPAGSQVYELTEWGMELEPIVTQLGRWGSRSPALPIDADTSVSSHMLSLLALFSPAVAKSFHATLALKIGDDDFAVRVADGALTVERGEVEQPDATLETDAATFGALLHLGHDLDAAKRSGEAHVNGSTAVVQRFLRLFPLPKPAFAG